MEFKKRNDPMPILIEHPDIPSTNPSILKRRSKEKELSPSSTKTVNFSRHPEAQSNGYVHQANINNNEDDDRITSKSYTHEDKVYEFRAGDCTTSPEQKIKFSWRRTRSHSLPYGLTSGVMNQGTRYILLKNRRNSKEANVVLPAYDIR